jgi:RinA family phage transcriptional activator
MRNKYKLESHKKNYIMHELYDYTNNKRKLMELQEEVLSSSSSSDGQPRGNQTGDPTGQKAIKLMTSRSIMIVTEKINNIERALDRLSDEEKDVVDIIFNKRCSQVVAETKYNISYDTYYNTKRKMIYLTAIEYGEI